jgi:hypothetical protein
MNHKKKPIHPRNKLSKLSAGLTNDFKNKLNSIKFKKDYQGDELNVFVGRYGYPKVNVGFIGNENITKLFDDPKTWADKSLSIKEITLMRSKLINSRFTSEVKTFKNKLLDKAREVSLTDKKVDMEINLEKDPKKVLSLHKYSAPTGPASKLKNARITSNTKINKSVDYVTSDTDLKAAPAITKLYKKGFDNYFLTKILSLGNLGLKYDRKIVPTRWSITATDDTIGKQLIKEIQKFPSSNYICTFGGQLGNYFITMFIPGPFAYELFEISTDSGGTWTDYEGYSGRKTYANNCGGGYYANRIAVLEKLKQIKRTATIITIRFITDEYYQPLGVWVVRESSRKAVNERVLEFADKELMLKYVLGLAKKYFNYDLKEIFSKSKLLKTINYQKSIKDFFN